jgi:hypothetical protein
MDTSRDTEAGARANLPLFYFGRVLLFEPDTSSTLNEVPDLVDIGEAGSDGNGLGRSS